LGILWLNGREFISNSPYPTACELSPIPLSIIADLGHAQISSTAIYTQPSEEEKAVALQKASDEL
jgi:hypothetical protein